MEAAAEGDDELLEKYLEGEELTIDELRQGLRQGMLTGRVCPVMCGSAVHHIGNDRTSGPAHPLYAGRIPESHDGNG
jgi:elongation factor G